MTDEQRNWARSAGVPYGMLERANALRKKGNPDMAYVRSGRRETPTWPTAVLSMQWIQDPIPNINWGVSFQVQFLPIYCVLSAK